MNTSTQGAATVDDTEGTEIDDMEDCSNEPRENRVAKFPSFVPMENAFRGSFYYVRNCYSEYYDLAMNLLDQGHCGVTITGTPGIGTSVFMAYFFSRYSKEHPSAFTTLASYNSHSRLETVVIAKAGEFLTKARYAPENERTLHAHVRDNDTDPQNLWLLDGPPDAIPRRVRWVSFTSPNKGWTKVLDKNPMAMSVYMPTWTLEELREAALQLGRHDLLLPVNSNDQLEIRADELRRFGVDEMADLENGATKLDSRFAVFGGVARVCLARFPTYVERQFESVTTKVKFMDINAVTAALGGNGRTVLVDGLLHYAPKEKKYMARIQVASPLVERYLEKREREILASK